MSENKCFAIVGWKNAGKTTLVSELVNEFTKRGLVVSSIKHAHHSFDLDREGTDSFNHRLSGAKEVMLVSGKRWALQHELRDEPEPSLGDMLDFMSPCDLVLIEGYKTEAINKIEILGDDASQPHLWKTDDHIRALASDKTIENCPLPQFTRDNIAQIADFIWSSVNAS